MWTEQEEQEAVEFWKSLKMYLNDAGYASFVDSGDFGTILWEMSEAGWNAFSVVDGCEREQLYEGQENQVPNYDELMDVRKRLAMFLKHGKNWDGFYDDGDEEFWFYDDNLQVWVRRETDEQEAQ